MVSGFISRVRQLTAPAFYHVCTVFMGGHSFPTLDQMRGELLCQGIRLSRSSLHERFSQKASAFMKSAFLEALSSLGGGCRKGHGLGAFSDVVIADSTVINLSGKCSGSFKGFGGGASSSAAKVMLCFGLLSSRVHRMELLDGTASDAGTRFSGIKAGALYLFDLGFFCAANLCCICNGGAFLVCRYKYGTTLFRPCGRKVGAGVLDRLVRRMRPGQTMELEVLVVKDSKIPMRLVLHKLPLHVGERIRRKMKTDKQMKCKGLSAGRLAFCDVNAYLTNIAADTIKAQDLRAVYAIRWQVELLFKSWKSGMEVDQVRNIGPHMFACLMYGRLIRVLLCTWIAGRAKLVLWEYKSMEISDIKAMATLNRLIGRIMEWIRGKTKANAKFLQQVWTTLSETCAKEPKAGCLAPWETINWNA